MALRCNRKFRKSLATGPGRGYAGLDGGGWFEALERRELLSVAFGAGTSVDSGTIDQPFQVVTADLDGDGDKDILSALQGDGQIVWYSNDGGGGFGAKQVVAGGFVAQSIFSSDLDGDGDLDVLASSSHDDVVVWFENDGSGGFGSERVIQSIGSPFAVYAADLDGDGDQDVLYSNFFASGHVYWHRNDGFGGFGSIQTITYTRSTAIGVADFDADGDLDLIESSFGIISWHENDGAGRFIDEHEIASGVGGSHPQSVFVSDLDGDGDEDVLSVSEDDDKVLWWYENDGSGGFGLERVITTEAGDVQSVFAADLDGDGDRDVLSASTDDDKIAWYENDGSGGFGAQQIVTTEADGAISVFADDLDGDGDRDVISASLGDDMIAWYKNMGQPPFELKPLAVITTDSDSAGSMRTIDFDGDGDQDVLTDDVWYENDGDGGFVPEDVTGIDGGLEILADLDGDGDQDKLLTETVPFRATTRHQVVWQENDGRGGFGFKRLIATNLDRRFRSITAADLDGDGDLDVLATYALSSFDATVVWYENPGDGSMGATVHVIGKRGDAVASNLLTSDLDGDGDQDVIYTIYVTTSPPSVFSSLIWHENIGEGEFSSARTIFTAIEDTISLMPTADLDGDGDQDIISKKGSDGVISWRENDGLGGFGVSHTTNIPWQPVAVVDLDNDGDLDILPLSQGEAIAWYRNDGSGQFESMELLTRDGSGSRSVVATDINGDGRLDLLSGSPGSRTIGWYDNVGHAPIGIGLSATGVDENVAPGTLVGALAIVDPDGSDTHTLMLLDDAGGRFRIVDSSIVVGEGAELDFESNPGPNMIVRAKDQDGLFYDETFTISVNNLNEPPVVSEGLFGVDRNDATGTVLGRVVSSDPDLDDMLTFSFIGVSGDGIFAVDPETGEITVADGDRLRLMAGPLSYELTVQVEDSGGLTDTAVLTLAQEFSIDAGAGDGGSIGNDEVADEFRIVRAADDVLVYVNEAVAFTKDLLTSPILLISGSGDNDTLVVDFSGGDPVPSAGIVFDGGDGGGFDTLVIEGAGVERVTHRFDSASSGSVDVDGMVVTYTGLEPIDDNLDAVDRVFVFGSVSDAIVLGDDDTADDGVSRISSAGSSEVVNFLTPTGTVTVLAGEGDDTVTVAGLDGAGVGVVVDGEGGDDALDASGVGFAVRLLGGTGDDTVVGGGGDDLVVWENGDGSDRIDGGGGSDTLAVSGSDEAGDRLVVRERDGRVELQRRKDGRFVLDVGDVEGLEIDGLGGDDRVRIKNHLGAAGLGAVTVRGGDGNDKIIGRGTDVPLTLEGGNGHDRLIGGRLGDLIDGGAGDDRIMAGAGDDMVLGGAGTDRLAGQGGIDTVNYETSPAGVSVSLTKREAAEDGFGFDDRRVHGFENVVGSAFNDLLVGDRRANILDGGGGENFLIGRGGGDTLEFDELLELDGDLSVVEL